MTLSQIVEQITTNSIEYIPKLIGAIAIWIVGMWILKILTNKFNRFLDKREIDVSLRPFIKGLFGVLLKILLVMSVLGTLGIKMTSFIAVIGAASLAIGLALSGTLQNFAGGMIILIFKPFKIGDLIETQGLRGTVSEIQIFSTILKTPDNKTVVIPNGGMSNSSITNYSTEARRRVDWVFGIAYGDDIEKAREVVVRLCAEDSRILNEPPVFVAVSELGANSVNMTIRAWVDTPEYWNVFFELNEKVCKNFDKEGLHIPFPQLDVHIQKTVQI